MNNHDDAHRREHRSRLPRQLGRYLWEKRRDLILWLLWTGVQALVFALYQISLEPLIYASMLGTAVGGYFFVTGFVRWRKRQMELELLQKLLDEKVLPLPEPHDLSEKNYQTLITQLAEARQRDRREYEEKQSAMVDFYTLWVHQIKTPIAAMRLLLQSDKETPNSQLLGELTRIEGYSEMVLSYMRLQSDETDYIFRKTAVDPLIRKTLRRFARLFIGGKLSVSFDGTGMEVVTDEKWLLIVLEQVISNAVKYTPPGGRVSIQSENGKLVIADTGIGIRKEDQPRVFERGYTGFNGRGERHSSGLGLYLCREIMDRLGGKISLDSEPGQGCRVILVFPERVEGYE